MKIKRIITIMIAFILAFSFTSGALADTSSPWDNFGIIKQGDSGGKVRGIQNVTKYYLNLGSSYQVDGSFGSGTKSAVKDYQRRKNGTMNLGLTVDGVVGTNTWNTMYKGLSFSGLDGAFRKYVTEYKNNQTYTQTSYFREYWTFEVYEWDTYKAASGNATGSWYRMD